jgi:hypothetical protein
MAAPMLANRVKPRRAAGKIENSLNAMLFITGFKRNGRERLQEKIQDRKIFFSRIWVGGNAGTYSRHGLPAS